VFDINPGELLILLVVAVVVIGPERLPKYAAELARMVREVRTFARSAREQVREELGEDFDDVDWQALDPRRYDPRRIVREALLDDDDEPQVSDRAPNVPRAMRPDGGLNGATAADALNTGDALTTDDALDSGGPLNRGDALDTANGGPLNRGDAPDHGPLNRGDDAEATAAAPSSPYDADAT
jgi:sec-independent protein translocase protein TatB